MLDFLVGPRLHGADHRLSFFVERREHDARVLAHEEAADDLNVQGQHVQRALLFRAFF